MEEVEQVRGGRTETLDPTRGELSDRLEEIRPQLRLPEKRVVRSLEDLSLLGDRAHHRLERRSPVQVAERAALAWR